MMNDLSIIEPHSSVSHRLRRVIRRMSIGQKISYGYALTLSIAVVVTVTGFIIGDYYQRQAREKREHAQSEIRLLHSLQSSVLEARSSQQQFIPLIAQPDLLKKEYSEYLDSAANVKQAWSALESYANSESYKHEKHADGIPEFLQSYRGVPNAYLLQVEELMKQIEPDLLKPKDVEATQKYLLSFTNSPLVLKFDGIDDDLVKMINASYQDDRQAGAALVDAETLRFQIILVSILLSVASAFLIAKYTINILTSPLVAVTQVAQHTTQELKFDRLALVTTEDEVGVLATSLNQLIQQLAKYTHELELAHHTLESRVQERTQELSQALQNLKQTQAQLIQSEKMVSLGQMVAGVAHEINNPVSFIHGNIGYLDKYVQDLLSLVHLYQQHDPSPKPEIQDQIEAIELDYLTKDLPQIINSMKMGTARIRELVKSLRNFSRLDEAELKPVNIQEGIDSTLLILNSKLKQGIDVVKQYGNLPLVKCYPAQLNQVFMNILDNAIDALIAQGEPARKQIVIQTAIVDSDQVQVRIRDSGPGIPESIQERVFDPFFTTKDVGKGTGLGLSISYQVIEKHKGKISVISSPGQGTEFVVTIPVQP